jgi:catechol 2,3-dioxygenase-like lactoylglutathione lyase family enzyme
MGQTMNFSIEHIGIPAADPVALKNWYTRVLGAQPIWENGQTPPSFLIALAGDAMLEIYPANAVSNPGRGDNQLVGFRHVALRVDSIQAAKAELSKRGVKFDDETRPAAGGGKVLFLEDGDGNLLHLVERPKDWKLDKV